MNDVELEVYSWAGLSIGAIHFYGEFHQTYGEYSQRKNLGRIQRKLSKSNAASINKRMRLVYSEEMAKFYSVEPGEMDNRFDREDQVISVAKKQWKKLYPDADRLILQSTGEVLDIK
jgi:hypothetical protein